MLRHGDGTASGFSPWTGEFIDRKLEADYRFSTLHQDVRISLIIVWAVVLAFVGNYFVDVLTLGDHGQRLWLGALTGLACMTGGLATMALLDSPTPARQTRALAVFVVVSSLCFVVTIPLRGDLTYVAPVGFTVTIVGAYLLAPLTLPQQHLVVGVEVGLGGIFWAFFQPAPPPPDQAARIVVPVLLILLMSVLISRRLKIARRLDFARVRALEGEIAERLRAESALRDAKERAEAATRTKAQFLAMMSHEIRTPMNGILGMVRLLQETPLDQDQREGLETIRQSGTTLLKLLNDILDLSNLDSGRLELETTHVELRELVDRVVQLVAPRAREKGLTMTVEISPDVPKWVRTDVVRLRQVLLNLLDNAVKFTAQGGVTVRVEPCPGTVQERDAPWVRFAVSDTGIGVPEDRRQILFNDFAQADASSSRRHEGAGLGLAIGRRLAALMGGRIEVQSKPGQGSSFHLDMPLTVALPPPADESAPRPTALRPLRVLLAEDNIVNRKVAVALLKGRGHRVTIAEDGAGAVEAAEAGEHDVVVMDIQMPGIDGLEAARRIRRLPAPKGLVPIVAMTATATGADEEKCLAAGMDGFLAKPLDVDALEAVFARLLPWAVLDGGEAMAARRLAALEQVMGREALAALARRFVEQAEDSAAGIAAAVEAGDGERAASLAHSLRSSSAQFGLHGLAEAAGRMEEACRRGRARDTLSELAREIAAGVVEARRMLPHPADPAEELVERPR